METAIETRMARYSVVQAETPEHGVVNIGVLLEDPESNTLALRFRRDLDSLADDDEDREVLEGLADDLAAKSRELGAAKLFEYLEANLSGAVRVTDREQVLVGDFSRALGRLYLKNVQSNVIEFRTHLPRYSLRAAAGRFLENQEIAEEGWIEAPEDLRLSTDMFVAQIAGHSMEPLIPDGSLCVFRYGVVGRAPDGWCWPNSSTPRATIVIRSSGIGEAAPRKTQKWIRLESLNPEYPSWDLDPDEPRPIPTEAKYRILAEFSARPRLELRAASWRTTYGRIPPLR